MRKDLGVGRKRKDYGVGLGLLNGMTLEGTERQLKQTILTIDHIYWCSEL